MKLPGIVYTSPVQYSLKQRVKLAVVPPIIAGAIKAINATCRWEVRDVHHLEDVIASQGTAILATWHETTGVLLSQHRGRNFHSTASFSFDGEMAARVVSWFDVETVRGSSSRGGSLSLEQMEKVAPLVPCVGLTADGPRGPRRVAKPGMAILAARVQKPIIPNACAVAPAWRLRSWDRFIIAKPFARVISIFGPPIPPPAADTPELVEETRQAVEQSLNALHKAIEAELGQSVPLRELTP